MGAAVLVGLVLAVWAGVGIAWARALDRRDAANRTEQE